jgi:pimeloyl-ACP methyl ester carboxylesterase
MVSRITRLLLLLQFFSGLALSLLARQLWKPPIWAALAFGFGLVLLVRLLINANNFFIAWRYRSDTPASLWLGWRPALRMFISEFSASMSSSSWTMPFHSFTVRPATNPVGLPVLLIHGYGCNSGYWHALSKRLLRERITHHAVDLDPMFAAIDDYVPTVHKAVEALCTTTGHQKIVIVAHSMGGLVARAYLREHGNGRVASVITLGTPHRGTGLANFGKGQNSIQMRWTGSAADGVPSEWLRALERTENDTVRALFTSIYSHHDNIISPQTSSHLAGAANIEFRGVGHVALGFDPAVQAKVIELVHGISPASQPRSPTH